ncbi:MAG: IS6 family transposase [Thaumarchaeota archaeon]|nr:IS6 family transposase [Nitrososphaerota archaeon]
METSRCKYCQSDTLKSAGSVNGRKLIKCVTCSHRFFANQNLPRMKVNKHVIVSAISLYFDGLSVRKVSRQLESIFGERISQMTIWNWVQKYSKLVSEYVKTLTPQLSGKWHHDETVIRCDGQNEWFWETMDEDTRFLVASHLSGTRSLEDTVAVFKKAKETAKVNPIAIFVDGSMTYDRAFAKVFYSRYGGNHVELVKRVGIRARETNNIVERLHETVKERVRPMRGFKNEDSARNILDGYVANYNFARPHLSLNGKTPAEEAGIHVKGWKQLIENAIQTEASTPKATEGMSIEAVQVVRN